MKKIFNEQNAFEVSNSNNNNNSNDLLVLVQAGYKCIFYMIHSLQKQKLTNLVFIKSKGAAIVVAANPVIRDDTICSTAPSLLRVPRFSDLIVVFVMS